MATIARGTKASGGTAFVDGTTAYGSEVETDFNTVYVAWNGSDAGTTAWTNVKTGNLTSTTTTTLKGSTTNDSAANGNIGEYMSQANGSYQNITSSTTFQNTDQVSLTAGDWDVTGQLVFANNGATVNDVIGALSLFSANTQTDHVDGDNVMYGVGTSSGVQSGVTISNWRVSIASTTIVYLKGTASFSAGTPQLRGRISARRIR